MLQNIPPQITATVLALLGAIIGYAFREYRNIARPFFHIITIDGGTRKKTDEIAVPQDIIDNLTGNFHVKGLKSESTLGDVDDIHEKAVKISKYWPAINRMIAEVIATKTEDELLDKLPQLFNDSMFEDIIIRLLVLDKITPSLTASFSAKKVTVHNDKTHDEGCVWLFFPQNSLSFGKNLNSPPIMAKCKPFIECIKYLDGDAIREALLQTQSIMQIEYQKSLTVVQPLKDIIDENSRWAFYAYFANLAHHPLVIQRSADIHIKDPQTGTFIEKCYLALVKDNKITDTATPIAIKAGEDATICFITDNIQKSMKNNFGKAIRESYSRGQGYCQLRISISKTGLFKKQRAISSKAFFRD